MDTSTPRTARSAHSPSGSARACVLGLAAAAGLALLGGLLVRDVAQTWSPDSRTLDPATGLGMLAELAAALTAAVLALLLGVAALAAAPGLCGAWVRRRGPSWVPRLAGLLVLACAGTPAAGAAPGTGGAGVAQVAVQPVTPPTQLDADAEPAAVPLPSWDSAVEPDTPLPGWRPTSPAVRSTPPTDLVTRGTAAESQVVVRRGDTLWAIAAQALGPGATVEDIARAWPRWYDANRAVIGPDPDLILPGQRLVPPATMSEARP